MDTSKKYVYARCILLYLVFFNQGMANSILGPSIPDLCERMGIDTDSIGIAFSGNAFAWLIATLVVGLVADRVLNHSDLIIAVLMGIFALIVIVLPFCKQLWVFVTCFTVFGLMDASLDIVCNVILISLWGQGADPHFQAMYCSWSLGSVVAPFLIRPFLSTLEDTQTNYTTSPSTQTEASHGNTWLGLLTSRYNNFSDNSGESRIEISYIILAIIMIILAIVSLCIYLVGSREHRLTPNATHKRLKDYFDLTKAAQSTAKFAIPMCLLFFLYYFAVAGAEMTLYTWLYTYAIQSDLPFTNQEAAILDASGKTAYLGGRIIDIALTKFLPIQAVLLVSSVLVALSGVSLATAGPKSKGALYATVCTFQFLIAPMWPGGISWLDKYLKVVAAVYMFSNLGASTSAMFFQWLSGELFANNPPESVLLIIMGCGILLCIVFMVMQAMGQSHGNRYKAMESKPIPKESLDGSADIFPSTSEFSTKL